MRRMKMHMLAEKLRWICHILSISISAAWPRRATLIPSFSPRSVSMNAIEETRERFLI